MSDTLRYLDGQHPHSYHCNTDFNHSYHMIMWLTNAGQTFKKKKLYCCLDLEEIFNDYHCVNTRAVCIIDTMDVVFHSAHKVNLCYEK